MEISSDPVPFNIPHELLHDSQIAIGLQGGVLLFDEVVVFLSKQTLLIGVGAPLGKDHLTCLGNIELRYEIFLFRLWDWSVVVIDISKVYTSDRYGPLVEDASDAAVISNGPIRDIGLVLRGIIAPFP